MYPETRKQLHEQELSPEDCDRCITPGRGSTNTCSWGKRQLQGQRSAKGKDKDNNKCKGKGKDNKDKDKDNGKGKLAILVFGSQMTAPLPP